MLQILLFLLTSAFLLLGGGFIILLYSAYSKTKQRFLLMLGFGFFLLVIGGALPVITFALNLSEVFFIIAIILQILGMFAIFYSTVR
ncbi:MAG: hypothetical protein QXN34_04840 [Archaeoglobaceae archaeon]